MSSASTMRDTSRSSFPARFEKFHMVSPVRAETARRATNSRSNKARKRITDDADDTAALSYKVSTSNAFA